MPPPPLPPLLLPPPSLLLPPQPPPPPPPPSLGPTVPLVHGDGAIIPRQFFSEAGSLCAADTGTARALSLFSPSHSSSFRRAFSPLYHFTTLRSPRPLPAVPPSRAQPPCALPIVLVRLRSPLSSLFRPRSGDRARFVSSCSSCPSKNDGGKDAPRKGTTRARAIKKGEILERDDKRREGSPHRERRREGRFPVVGIFLGAEAAATGTHQQRPRVSIFVRFSFCSAAIDDSITSAKGERRTRDVARRRKTGNGRGLFDIRGGREVIAAQLVTQTDPFLR